MALELKPDWLIRQDQDELPETGLDNVTLKDYENDLVVSMTGTIDYESKVAIEILNAKKHLVTMNAELQATLGTELKKIADSQGVIITDVFW